MDCLQGGVVAEELDGDDDGIGHAFPEGGWALPKEPAVMRRAAARACW
jgi:hypothetical protein